MIDEELTLNFEPINHVHSMPDLMCLRYVRLIQPCKSSS
jgi:hypothetical protein